MLIFFFIPKKEVSVQVSLCKWKLSKKETILNMDEKKASLTDDIPARILNGCVD